MTGPSSEIWVVASDGSSLRRVTGHYFVWAPDASRIAYVIRGAPNGIDPEASPELYTVRPDGSDRARLHPASVATE